MSRPTRNARLVDLSLLAVAITWGSSYLGAKTVVTPDTVTGFLTVRFAIAVACLAVVLLPRLRRTTARELKLGGLYGSILAGIFVLETAGVIGTTASNAGLIISLTMLFTPLLEGRLKGTRIPRRFYAAAFLALLGVALLTQAQGLSTPSWGDGLIFLAAIARAIHVTVIDATSGDDLDSARVTVIQLSVVLVAMAAASTNVGASPFTVAHRFTATDWAITVYLALTCTVFAFFVQMWAVQRTSPSRVSLLLGTEPLWAAIVGISLGSDPLTVTVVLGAALILGGTAIGRTTAAEATRQTNDLADERSSVTLRTERTADEVLT